MTMLRNQKTVRLQFVMSLISVGIGLVVLTLRDDFVRILYGRDYYPSSIQIFLIPGLLLVAIGVGGLLLLYLRGAISIKVLDNLVSLREDQDERVTSLAEYPEARLSALETRLQEVAASNDSLRNSQAGLAIGDKTDLLASVLPTIHSGVADELERRFSASAQDGAALVEIRQVLDRAHRRLHIELESLSRRSNLNLVIGVLTTTLAVSLLAYMVLGHGGKFESITDLLAHYVPRVTIVVFVEVFSFFFLRLYRTTLSEIRKYQDDLTWLAVRQCAIETGWRSTDPSSRTVLSKELLASSSKNVDSPAKQPELDVDAKALADLLVKFTQTLIKKEKDG